LHPDQAARYRADGHWLPVPLGAAFAETCARQPYELALIDGERRLTFAELDRLSARAALGLLALGVGPGDVVAYQLPNWWEAAVVFLAAARIGAVVNPVLPSFRARELGFILAQSGASVLFIPGALRGSDHREIVRGLALPALRDVLVVRDEPAAGMRSFAQFMETPWERAPQTATPQTAYAPQTADRVVTSVDAASLLLLMYTSGTSAEPKGVLHTHETLMAEIRSLARVHQLTAADTTLMPSPVTHISGVVHGILTPALLGTTAVLVDRWDAEEALACIARERVTYMVGAPTFLQDLSAAPTSALARGSLRLFSCGGAAVSETLIRQARAALGCVAKRVYGSTEFPTITTTDADDAPSMGAETEGRAIWPAEVRIVDGEIQARGPECCVGYADPALNADAFTADGWFRTGDLGHLDAAGYLRITGRVKDIVIRKGEKISVRELEELIGHHPAVAEVVVVALPDPVTGERACAVVVPRAAQSVTLAELTAFLAGAGLARVKWPEQLELRHSLPRTESGKLHRAQIRAALLR
jgi:cyclohexanecarboxylate-CoA ligase